MVIKFQAMKGAAVGGVVFFEGAGFFVTSQVTLFII